MLRVGLLLGDRGQFAAADAPFRAARESAERHYGTGAIATARYLDDWQRNWALGQPVRLGY